VVASASTVEEKLQQLRSIISSLRYVQRGDYIRSEDHNKIIDALKLVEEIISEVKDTASLYYPINADYDIYSLALRLARDVRDKYGVAFESKNVVFNIVKPLSRTFSPGRTLITLADASTVKRIIDSAVSRIWVSEYKISDTLDGAYARTVFLAAFRVTDRDVERVQDVASYFKRKYPGASVYVYALVASVVHSLNNTLNWIVSAPVKEDGSVSVVVRDNVSKLQLETPLDRNKWYYIAAYTDAPNARGFACIYDSALNSLFSMDLVSEPAATTGVSVYKYVGHILVDPATPELQISGIGVDYVYFSVG